MRPPPPGPASGRPQPAQLLVAPVHACCGGGASHLLCWRLMRLAACRLESLDRQERRGAQDPGETMQGTLHVNGREARVSLSVTGLEWSWLEGGCLCDPATSSETLPFAEMLAVRALDPGRSGLGIWPAAKVHRLAVFSFQRSPGRRCDWGPRRVVLESTSQDAARDWCTALASGIEGSAGGRPRSLLVVLNPNAGYRRSRVVYKRIVEPVLAAAGIKVQVVETQYPGHAAIMMREMRLEQLCSYDGVVGVGGDGVFHEVGAACWLAGLGWALLDS